MKNFSFEHDNQTLWYTRNIQCTVLCYAFDTGGRFKVLVCKQSENSSFMPGKWTTPGGYLNFNESMPQCASRKLFSNCGINIPEKDLTLLSIDSDPNSDDQTVVVKYVYLMPYYASNAKLSVNSYNVDTARWVECDAKDIMYYDWANGQIANIQEGMKYIKKKHRLHKRGEKDAGPSARPYESPQIIQHFRFSPFFTEINK